MANRRSIEQKIGGPRAKPGRRRRPVSSTPQSLTALEAREKAQCIAFAPFVFHASRVLRDSGILASTQMEGELSGGTSD
jgi:hypothetical protein